jgi:hypothetical protein
MKYLLGPYIILLSLFGCIEKSSVETKDFPFVVTLPVTDIDETGATFNAELIDPGKEEIKDFGFYWKGQSGTSSISLFDKGPDIRDFSYRITYDLFSQSKYICYAYVSTENFSVKGNIEHFTAKGQTEPVIQAVYPEIAADLDTMILTGEHFSNDRSNIDLRVEKTRAPILYSSFDSIVFISPKLSHSGYCDIELQIANHKVSKASAYEVLGLNITNVSSYVTNPGDTLIIEGENFLRFGELSVYISSTGTVVPFFSSNSRIELVVPTPLYGSTTGRITVRSGHRVAYINHFQIIVP